MPVYIDGIKNKPLRGDARNIETGTQQALCDSWLIVQNGRSSIYSARNDEYYWRQNLKKKRGLVVLTRIYIAGWSSGSLWGS